MGKYGFAIDRGGTFTDVYIRRPDGSSRVMKLLSEDPQNYRDAPTEAIRRVLESELGKPMPRGQPVDASEIEWIRMGTTVATNALLERKGQRSALAITKGFRDLLYIGNQSRPRLFDLSISMPDVLYEEIVEIDERVVLCRDDCQVKSEKPVVEASSTGDKLEVWRDIDEPLVEKELKGVLDKGITSLAVVLLHSYMYDEHEKKIGSIAKKLGFENVSLSSHIMPMIKAVPRGFTASADAYLTPVIQRYIHSFTSGFKNMENTRVLFMQSDGGLSPVDTFHGSRAILSGPAGGVVGVALTAYEACGKQPVVGFDMGGTSTDVSRYAGDFDHVFETTTAGVTIQAPQLDVNTVAAGGGSRLFFRDGMLDVGPESAGANPGPVCYKKGGHLAITDANLVLGRILPQYFPKIFGPSENEPLDSDAANRAMEEIRKEINKFSSDRSAMSKEDVALGFVDVANEKMCRPIRALTQAKGYDTSQHVLACFGGAGAQHACSIAKSLGMKSVFIHRYAGILSAYGLALADVVYETQEPCHTVYSKDNFADFDQRLTTLADRCREQLRSQGFKDDQIVTEPYLYMRYDRTDCALMCKAGEDAGYPAEKGRTPEHGDFEKSFLDSYKREFGFTIPGRTIMVDDVRIRGIGRSGVWEDRKLDRANDKAQSETTVQCYFKGGYKDTAVYFLDKLLAGHEIPGPAIIIDVNSTIVVEPDCLATITDDGNVRIKVGTGDVQKLGTEVDSIQLAIFSHRFMSIAEQMGRILQRTAISTNIKERLDFSCALFGPDGGLVANAPHIPVHLGAMQEAVRFQMNHLGDKMKEGDVILCNHPSAGGSHLPDLTVITPVYYKHSKKPVFFVANRGHHADIGGLVPGSMPPHSTNLDQEGACFLSFKLVENGEFQEDAVTEALKAPGRVPGCSGTRNLSDNLSDLRAQVAANQKGIGLVCDLIDIYGEDVVQAYMGHIQDNADLAVREMLKETGRRAREETGQSWLHAVDYMDDGTPIELTVKIDESNGEALFDFTGTGIEVYGSCNAPRAVTQAAIVYCIRCLVGRDIPLNQGCMKPIKTLLPQGCLLHPSPSAAVVGGNVLTSQRVVDVILKAFNACAASQGCMNNITFGDENVGYYETVAGGAGAGPNWTGHSGIHTHMTNTRITDPEIMERRYPIVLNRFHLRSGSGGAGKYKGGDGVVREYLFRKDLTLSILTERRVFAPYGGEGGEPGAKGVNLLRFKAGRTVNLGAKASVPVNAGDVFLLQTPGGGGWGNKDSTDEENEGTVSKIIHAIKAAGSLFSYQQTQESA